MLRQVAAALTTGSRWNFLLGSEDIYGRSRQVVTEDGDPYTVVFGEDPMRVVSGPRRVSLLYRTTSRRARLAFDWRSFGE
jgi:hypothetical protein